MKNEVWIIGGMVSVVAIGVVKRGVDVIRRMPITLRETHPWAASAYDWYAWWKGWDI